MNTTGIDAFEGIKNQIGTCGIWCGSCVDDQTENHMAFAHPVYG
jgi:hypothetical protein